MRFWLSRLRSYFFWDPLIWIYTIVLGCVSLFCSLFDRDGRIQHRLARFWSNMILRTIGAQVSVEGMEKIDTNHAHVYVVNHLSALDIPVLYAYLPAQFRILAKKELFRYPFMGWHLSRSGQIPVDQQSAKSSLRSLNLAVQSLKDNMPLMIFPEGGRSADGHLQKFMFGAFYTAIKAQAQVVPMALVGTYEVLPINTWHIQPRPIRLVVGEPVSTTGLSARDMDALTERVREAIADLYYTHAELPDLRHQYLKKNESKQ